MLAETYWRLSSWGAMAVLPERRRWDAAGPRDPHRAERGLATERFRLGWSRPARVRDRARRPTSSRFRVCRIDGQGDDLSGSSGVPAPRPRGFCAVLTTFSP